MRLRRQLTLRTRVTFALVALVALFVFVLGLLAILSLDEQEDDLADAWVLTEARRLAVLADRGELDGPDDAPLFKPASTLRAWLVAADGKVLPEPLPAYLEGMREGLHWRRIGGGEMHVAVLATRHGILFVEYDARATEAKVFEFALYMLSLGAFCIVLAYVVARRVASVLVGPIERLTQQLGNWAPEAVDATSTASDEEERLLEAFHRVQSRFELRVAREREFLANVRHEVRTPLAALRTDLEMLALDGRGPLARAQRLKRALSMVDAVNAALEAASTLSAREPSPVRRVELRQCVDDAWASLHADVGIGRLTFANEVAQDATVEADRHSLLTILRNLIRNAAEHAEGARCVVSFRAGCIEVSDDGPGIPEADLPFVFDRYYRGRYRDAIGSEISERGIGLAIARQVADLNGWSLTARAGSGSGACFVLRLA